MLRTSLQLNRKVQRRLIRAALMRSAQHRPQNSRNRHSSLPLPKAD